MGPGPLIAIYMISLYMVLGPLVLFVIYVLFDSLEKIAGNPGSQKKFKKDPALWTEEDIERFLD